MRRTDHRKLINIYTEIRPVSSVALIGAGIIALFVGEFPIGIAALLNGIAVGVMSSPPYAEKQKVAVAARRRSNRF